MIDDLKANGVEIIYRDGNLAYSPEKGKSGQTNKVVINLDDSKVTFSEMSEQLKNYPIEGLEKAIGVKNGEIVDLFS